jgi:hypothetical protein
VLLRKKRFWCVLLVPLSILLTQLAHNNPAATERWFSMGVFRVWTETYGRIFGYLPFSVFQFVIILFPIGALVYIIFEIVGIIRKKGFRKKYAVRLVANSAFVVGLAWFLFTIGVGINYGREEFGRTIGLETRASYVTELAALTEILVGHVNEVSTRVQRNEYGHMVVSAGSYFALSREARQIFGDAAEDFPVLRGFVPQTKPILYSRFMSRLRIAGVFVPWTMEPHVNVHIMDYHIPAVMIHELAHFRGIMREDEANFIAWLVGHRSGHPDFMYSAAMLALSYAAGQLSRFDRDEHSRIMGGLCGYARTDRRANWEYWQQFEGPLAEISQSANDAYLRAQRQEDGVLSYGRVVDLLLAYFRDEIAEMIAN